MRQTPITPPPTRPIPSASASSASSSSDHSLIEFINRASFLTVLESEPLTPSHKIGLLQSLGMLSKNSKTAGKELAMAQDFFKS